MKLVFRFFIDAIILLSALSGRTERYLQANSLEYKCVNQHQIGRRPHQKIRKAIF